MGDFFELIFGLGTFFDGGDCEYIFLAVTISIIEENERGNGQEQPRRQQTPQPDVGRPHEGSLHGGQGGANVFLRAGIVRWEVDA